MLAAVQLIQFTFVICSEARVEGHVVGTLKNVDAVNLKHAHGVDGVEHRSRLGAFSQALTG